MGVERAGGGQVRITHGTLPHSEANTRCAFEANAIQIEEWSKTCLDQAQPRQWGKVGGIHWGLAWEGWGSHTG